MKGKINMSQSLITKKKLAIALKELTKVKSFQKISVSDITTQCKFNRQTFYYHFQDKYDLLNWIYYNEIVSPMLDNLNFENWDLKLLSVLEQLKKEQLFYINTIKNSDNYFRNYIFKMVFAILTKAIKDLGINHKFTKEERIIFIQFYSYGVVDVIIEWATTGMKISPKQLTNYIKILFSK